MSKTKSKSNRSTDKEEVSRKKKPYSSPYWERQEIFEKTALACGNIEETEAFSGPLSGY